MGRSNHWWVNLSGARTQNLFEAVKDMPVRTSSGTQYFYTYTIFLVTHRKFGPLLYQVTPDKPLQALSNFYDKFALTSNLATINQLVACRRCIKLELAAGVLLFCQHTKNYSQ